MRRKPLFEVSTASSAVQSALVRPLSVAFQVVSLLESGWGAQGADKIDSEEEKEGGGRVYSESYTREARCLTRWDQHAVAQRRL